MVLTWPKAGSIWKEVCRLETWLHIVFTWVNRVEWTQGHSGAACPYLSWSRQFSRCHVSARGAVALSHHLHEGLQMKIVQDNRKKSQPSSCAGQCWKINPRESVWGQSQTQEQDAEQNLNLLPCGLTFTARYANWLKNCVNALVQKWIMYENISPALYSLIWKII